MKTLHPILTLLLLAVLTACGSTPTDTHAPRHLRVLSYNIHHGEGVDGAFDYHRLANVIRSTKPDVVALQEVDNTTGRASGIDQAAILGELTGMYHYFAQAMPFDGGGYGEAVLSRFPIEKAWTVNLSCQPGQEPRAVASIFIRPWGEQGPGIVFAGTHLCHQSAQTRLAQVDEINTAFSQNTILAGDFNLAPDTRAYQRLTQRWTDTAVLFGNAQPTFPSQSPDSRIDYVFTRPAGTWRIVNVQVLDEPVASDHSPLLVVMKLVE